MNKPRRYAPSPVTMTAVLLLERQPELHVHRGKVQGAIVVWSANPTCIPLPGDAVPRFGSLDAWAAEVLSPLF